MSANILVKKTCAPEYENYDFFNLALSNHVVSTTLSTSPLITPGVLFKVCYPGTCITKLGLSNACTYDQEGNVSTKVTFPFKVVFTPSKVHLSQTKPETLQKFLDRFAEIPTNSTLYTIKGYESPSDEKGVDLGEMINTGKCLTSYFGDRKLNFYHQRIEEDIALKPEWEKDLQTNCMCNGNGIDEPKKKCDGK